MELRAVFIKNLKMIRKERKISQMKLAELCSSSTNYIGEIEIGKKFPSIEMIQKISEALCVEPYKFFVDDIKSFENTTPLPDSKDLLIKRLQQSIREIVESEVL